jgi:hypothetical protein
VPPKEETAFTLMIQGAKADSKSPGRFDLVLQSASGSVVVTPARLTFNYELAKGGGGIGDVLLIGAALLIVVGLVAFLMLRRRRR